MAAFGILAALRSGRGAVRRHLDGRRRAVAAGDARRGAAGGRRRRRAAASWCSAGGCSVTGRTAAPTAGSRWARWSRSSGRRSAAASGRDGPDRAPVRPPGSRRARARSRRCCAQRTRAEWEAFNAEHDCCLEPVLELDEALADEQVAARGMVADGLLATPVKLSRDARGLRAAAPPPGLGEHTDAVLARGGLRRGRDRGAARGGSGEVSAFFVPLGDGRYRATERTSGPWDPRHQHAGPPSALLTGALERTAPREDMVLARVTVEILGAVPIAEVEVETSVERPGRSVELLAGELRADGRRGAAGAGVAGARRRRSARRRRRRSRCPRPPSRRRRRSARRSATRTRSSGAGRAAAGRSAGRRRSGRACGSRSSRARSRRRASA